MSDSESSESLLTARRTLDGRIRWLWLLRVGLVTAVVGIVVGIAGVFVTGSPLPGVGMALVVLFLGLVHTVLLYRSWEYELREHSLFLERGVITRVKTVVPYVRIQHIDTNRSPAERALGLSSLVVFTAGSRGADVTIPGLTPGEADDLQERLKVLAGESTGEDAV